MHSDLVKEGPVVTERIEADVQLGFDWSDKRSEIQREILAIQNLSFTIGCHLAGEGQKVDGSTRKLLATCDHFLRKYAASLGRSLPRPNGAAQSAGLDRMAVIRGGADPALGIAQEHTGATLEWSSTGRRSRS